MGPPAEEKKPGGDLEAVGELLLSLFITAFSIFVIVESARMPQRGKSVVMGPGFVPLFTGLVLLILGLILVVRAWRLGGRLHLIDWVKGVFADEENRRLAVILGLMGLYTVVLLGNLNFILATAIFHLLIFAYLKVGGPVKIGLYTALATVLVSVALPRLFEMPVP